MNTRVVTEEDFRMPEFRDARVEDYEFRQDGALVRKDRWEKGIYSLAGVFGVSRSFEIPQLIEQATKLKSLVQGWIVVTAIPEETPAEGLKVTLLLKDGCMLPGATTVSDTKWVREGVEYSEQVYAWRHEEPYHSTLQELIG